MFCSQCGTPSNADAKFCTKCGHNLQDFPPVPSSPVTAAAPDPAKAKSEPRPWVRYWARMFDLYAFAIIAGFTLGIIAPEAVARMNDLLLGMVLTLAWVFVEAALLSTFQTTPGKWLLKTKLRSDSGEPISYGQAFNRSLLVWWRGLGTGFPIVSLVTLIVARRKLRDEGKTTWDAEGGFTVTHEKIGVPRIIGAIFCLFLVIFLVALGGSILA